jgi:hypothetical protein
MDYWLVASRKPIGPTCKWKPDVYPDFSSFADEIHVFVGLPGEDSGFHMHESGLRDAYGPTSKGCFHGGPPEALGLLVLAHYFSA